MRKVLFLLAVFALTAAVPVYAANNVSGTWVLTQMSPMGGEEIWDVVITQDGENLNVTATNSQIQAKFSGDGTLKGSKIKFSLKSPDNQIEFIFEGEVTGKKMEGTREIQDGSGDKVPFYTPPSGGEGDAHAGDHIEISNTWSAVMK